MSSCKIHAVKELTQKVLNSGFRVFVAERGDYGFFTDSEGKKVVSFGFDGGVLVFSGNYVTDNPSQTGTGWIISNYRGVYSIREALFAYPPSWAVGGSKWRYTSLKEHLKEYQSSSNYVEVKI